MLRTKYSFKLHCSDVLSLSGDTYAPKSVYKSGQNRSITFLSKITVYDKNKIEILNLNSSQTETTVVDRRESRL